MVHWTVCPLQVCPCSRGLPLWGDIFFLGLLSFFSNQLLFPQALGREDVGGHQGSSFSVLGLPEPCWCHRPGQLRETAGL